MIKTSIIIPIYNTKEYLEQCVESVLAQTQKEIEIILVDDGSTDGCTHMIQEYERKYSVIKAIYQENQKLGAARNAGVKVASGEYIYFLDSDDYIREDLLEKCYQVAEKAHLDFGMIDTSSFVDDAETLRQQGVVIGKYDRSIVPGDGKVYSGIEFWEKYYSKGGVYSCACLLYINTDFLRRNNLYFESGIYYEDMDWMVRMYLCAEKIAYIPQQFHYRRYRANSITTAKYNDIHLKSCIVSCKKMMEMLLKAQGLVEQNMIVSVLAIMLRRCEEIFEVYCREDRLEKLWPEMLEFYRYLLIDIGTSVNNEKAQVIALKVLETIKLGMQNYNAAIDLSPRIFEEYKSQVIRREFDGYWLDEEGKRVGIYGSGVICERFLSMYRKLMGEIVATLFFIDTHRETGGSFQGYPLYNIKDISELKVDSFIIASSRYREEMSENIRANFLKEVDIKYIPEFVKVFNTV